jgi:RNA polymerase sigma-70 factor (ECF subfamily)
MSDPLLPDPSDELLAERVVQRDMAAFSIIYDRYAQPIYAMAAHMLGVSEAEEIVQEVFLRLWNRVDQFDSARGHFGPWLMTIARHRILDELRSRSQDQRFMAADEIDQLLEKTADSEVDVEEEVASRERNEIVFQALKTLPPEQRRVLILAYFGGLSQSFIAEHLNWPLGTVKKRIQLGLRKLRSFLNGTAIEKQIERTGKK